MNAGDWPPEPWATTRKEWEHLRESPFETLVQECADTIRCAKMICAASAELRRKSAAIRDRLVYRTEPPPETSSVLPIDGPPISAAITIVLEIIS